MRGGAAKSYEKNHFHHTMIMSIVAALFRTTGSRETDTPFHGICPVIRLDCSLVIIPQHY